MIEQKFNDIYNKFKLNFYKTVLGNFEKREATLTVAETFCAEVIFVLGKPTVGQLVEFLNIAQPNMTYRVNSLVKKGYVKKTNSTEDKRIVYLEVTDKYKKYQELKDSYGQVVMERLKDKLSKEEQEKFESILTMISEELMFEINEKIRT